jgi:hypothetical protein
VVDKPAPTKSVIRCETCHNPAADALTSVTFPSGVKVDGLGGEARCMTCHQGRASGKDVDAQITAAAVASDDEVSSALKFTNIHYYPAAATLFAGKAKGGYQYAGQVYDVRFRHVDGLTTASAATIRIRPRCASTSAPGATPASRTSATRTRSG